LNQIDRIYSPIHIKDTKSLRNTNPAGVYAYYVLFLKFNNSLNNSTYFSIREANYSWIIRSQYFCKLY